MAQNPLGGGLGGGLLGRFQGLLGSATVRAILIWQVAAQLFSAILAPVLAEIQQQAFNVAPVIPLSPSEAAAATVKSHMSAEAGATEARKSGTNRENFDLLVAAIQNPPGVETLLELWRRGLIEEAGAGAASTSVEQGIREGQTGNKWIEPLKRLRYQLPAPGSALRALLEGQTTEANARDLYAKWGGAPEFFDLLFNVEGSAPTPLEAAEMARRNIIPWEGEGPGVVSYRQAFLEGPWRNKWEKPYRSLAEYIPPPRTVTAMVREGSINDTDALDLFRAAGLNDKLAAAYLAAAHRTKVAADHELAKADVLTLYRDQLITRDQATTMLAGLRYSAENAAFLLDYTDFQREKSLLDKAVAKVANLYIGHKISKDAAMAALDGLGLAGASRDHLLLTWDREREINVKVLTAAEIAAAAKASYLTPDAAYQELQDQGYSQRDAAIFLLLHKVQPPGGPPPS